MTRKDDSPPEPPVDVISNRPSSRDDLRSVDAHELDGRIMRVVLGVRDWTPAERNQLRSDPKWKKWEHHYRAAMNHLASEYPNAIVLLRDLYRELPAEPERVDDRGRKR